MGYNKEPETKIYDYQVAVQGSEKILGEIQRSCKKENATIVIDSYPGVNNEVIYQKVVAKLSPQNIYFADNYAISGDEINKRVAEYLTDDRVFGRMTNYRLDEFFEDTVRIREEIKKSTGLTVIYGTGAGLLAPKADLTIYCDISRWEIQLRYRQGMPNWKQQNNDEDTLKKVKRGYFFEWRMADRYKLKMLSRSDYVIDANDNENLKMTKATDLLKALEHVAQRPFRTVPYFDASVWGGQWMKKNFHLSKDHQNYGWAFDGVPEENSLFLRMGDVRFEFPSMDLVLTQPQKLLGSKVYARFGAEFPIRFDYLDTMDGGNLSLQVHPLTGYIREKYGMAYTQDESYYILESTENSTVYLGLKNNVDKKEFARDLKASAEGKMKFPDGKYVNCWTAKKGDHFLIPAGTIHCGGKDTVILEISATPYIFTFKLWDWGRIGLDGKPRPIHVNEGLDNIQFDRDEKWTKENLINQFTLIEENSREKIVRTGLKDSLEFIESYRHTIKTTGIFKGNDSVNMLNLVDGQEAWVKSLDGSFEPYHISFGETFIIPASVGDYLIENPDPKNEISVIQAYVK